MRVAVASIALLAFSFLAAPQDNASAPFSSPKPKFEVASVKECNPKDGKPAPSRISPGRISLSCWSLKTLIQQAYAVFGSGSADTRNPGIPAFPVEGFPDWANSALYSIDAKTESPQSAATMRGPMMQALLEERFRLKVHLEKREVPVYLMSVARGPLKLHATQEGTCVPFDFSEALNLTPGSQTYCGPPSVTRRGPVTILDMHGITLGAFSKMLHPDGRPVIDRTGLSGAFDIHLELGADVSAEPLPGVASDPSPHASDVVAIREQLGLQLTGGRGISEILIVDHIERVTEN